MRNSREDRVRYMAIVDDIRVDIKSGRLNEGDRIPSQSQLMARYTVTRQTVQKAVAALVAEGLLITRVGAGAYVRGFNPIVRHNLVSPDDPHAVHTNSDTETTLDVDLDLSPPPTVVAALSLNNGDPALRHHRRVTTDGRTVRLATSWYPHDRGASVVGSCAFADRHAADGRNADRRHQPVRSRETVRCRMPDTAERDALSLSPGTPVAEITRHTYDEAGRCIEVHEIVLDGSAHLLVYELPLEPLREPTSDTQTVGVNCDRG
ncbi:GntR family transcriptional regulator [Couchioplanes caeruleus]|uniref:GntR family transcriptional regulator n=2 Tax=Couchioplanes caeruleus TaxID=56438 RepID=A0A3N1GRF0_9ACTN|nr:GntR family transcriptional regulator [Couchioplanes caeruleus]